jgi:hypothetical protein
MVNNYEDEGSRYVHKIGRTAVLATVVYLNTGTIITIPDPSVRTRY